TLLATDPDNDPLSYIVTSLPAAGTGSLHAGATVAAPVISVVPATLPGNQVTYEPPPNANGAALASFQFKVNDSHVDSNLATVTINVTAVNDAPVLAGIEAAALSYVESLNPAPPGASQLTNTLTVADGDNATLPSGSVQLTGNYQTG